ncbi:MAG: hypothetical protein FWG85_02290 [Bacteroidetes bacterium]|nr:hypothetical protein [Bacteroidota bacterium]
MSGSFLGYLWCIVKVLVPTLSGVAVIECYWCWLRKDCLNCKYYDNFTKFKLAIENSLLKTVRKANKDALKTLLNQISIHSKIIICDIGKFNKKNIIFVFKKRNIY